MAPKRTRNSQKDIVLGFGIHQSLALGPKLSLKIAVLKRVLHLRKNNKLVPTRELCGIVFQELKALWSRAGIPIKDDHNCIHKIVALWESYLKIKKIPATRNAERIENNSPRPKQFVRFVSCRRFPTNAKFSFRNLGRRLPFP